MIEAPTLEKQAQVAPVVEAATAPAENLNPDQLRKAQDQLASSLKSLMSVNVPPSLEAQYQNGLQGLGQVLEKLNQMVKNVAPAEPKPAETPAPVKPEPPRQKVSPFAPVRQLFSNFRTGRKAAVDVRTAPSVGENQGVAGSASPEPFGYEKGKVELAEENEVLNKNKVVGEAAAPTPPAEPLQPHQEPTQTALRTGKFDVSSLQPVGVEPPKPEMPIAPPPAPAEVVPPVAPPVESSKPAEPQSEVPPTALMPAVEPGASNPLTTPEATKNEVEKSYEVSKTGYLSIGRSPDNTVPLIQNYVSGHHAKVSMSNLGPTIVDVGSSHGTFINKIKLPDDPDKLRRLEDGDEISLSDPNKIMFKVRRAGDQWFLDQLKA